MTTRPRRQGVGLDGGAVRAPGPVGAGEWVECDGERFYRIENYHGMPPFLVSVVSGYDHWMFVSSTGGLTCGRRDPENALFPYCTDDKLHDACTTTGPLTVLLATRDDDTRLWRPFDPGPTSYAIERNLYKNVPGNKLTFEEVNRDLGLTFAYTWTTGNRFGFVRRARLTNTAASEVRVDVLDGVRNLLPYGVRRSAQAEMSTLVDAYKQAEAVPGACAGIYTLSSILTDRAEPSEALKATLVWSTGLEDTRVLLSEDQVRTFQEGGEVRAEPFGRGKRGAFLILATVTLPARAGRDWSVIADVEQGPSATADRVHEIRRGVAVAAIDQDVEAGTARLERLAGSADAFQASADDLVAARHFSNTLFNIMRGGVFPYGYRFPREDFLDFVRERNRPLAEPIERALGGCEGPLTLESAVEMAEAGGDPDILRLVHEYLPLTFSRRHGDPSRPWNQFSITMRNGRGSEYLNYEGNWRDIFQNWEALAISFPEYIESFVAKFVNASTPDGHNAYRISRDGIDWETLDPRDAWSNIGYWGDHQVGYLYRLLELSRAHHPGRLARWLGRDLFVYADVPYRIGAYRDMLDDPRRTVRYDDVHARAVERRVAALGADGKLVTLPDGTIHRVNLLEKLLVAALARMINLVPGGGIWMNTQRPEWNDANNALVGYGLSMVSLGYLRRLLNVFANLLDDDDASGFDVSVEVAAFLDGVADVLRDPDGLLEGDVEPAARKAFMDRMGPVADAYRRRVYRGPSGERRRIAAADVAAFLRRALDVVDHTIAHGRRPDGLFHAYNLIRFGNDGHDVEPLDEMLEGQVAALSSGCLDAAAALDLLEALRASRLYREDQNSYVLYPDRKLPSFLDKNVVPPALVNRVPALARQLNSGRTDYVERDVHGRVHFNGVFRNASELQHALESDPAVAAEDVAELCSVYEAVFDHRKFTGRSGSMYKYEGLGCIYWHMVSKLLLATGEVIARTVDLGEDRERITRLTDRFREIQAGLGVHKSPADYGAFPTDPYSHTPGFAGVQQPGLTGQVKEDVITRFWQLGVRVSGGAVAFEPVVLGRDEFLAEARSFRLPLDDAGRVESLPAGSLAFTLCGVPVVYRIADAGRIHVHQGNADPTSIEGVRLDPERSRSLFRRDGRITRLVVDVPRAALGRR